MQTDLFGTSQTPSAMINSQQPKPHFLEGMRFSLRLDQALVAAIALLVVFVLVFSFGVEKGKRFALAELKSERAKREKIIQEFRAKLFETGVANPVVLRMQEDEAPGKIEIAAPASKIQAGSVAAVESGPGALDGKKYPAGKYTVQLITFTSQKMAEKEIGNLVQKGHQPFVIPSGRYLQVCANGFDSRESAEEFLRELKARNLAPRDAYVRSIPQ